MNIKRSYASIHIRPRRKRYRKASVNSPRKPTPVIDPRKAAIFFEKKRKSQSKKQATPFRNHIYKWI